MANRTNSAAASVVSRNCGDERVGGAARPGRSTSTAGGRSVSRRQFLQSGLKVGGTAAGAWVLAPGAWAADELSTRKVRIGVVGGRFGASFQWHEHPNCEVVAVTDLRPERRKRLQRVYRCDNVYDSMEIMLKQAGSQLDAVAIFTEAPNHVRHTVAAMKAGKHVVCAVPAAMSLEECEQLIETVKKTGLTFMMAETSYWQQHTISARKFYQEGRFGTLFAAYSMYRHPGLETLWFENGKPTWRHGFPPMHYPTHCTAHLIGVTGERLIKTRQPGEFPRHFHHPQPGIIHIFHGAII